MLATIKKVKQTTILLAFCFCIALPFSQVNASTGQVIEMSGEDYLPTLLTPLNGSRVNITQPQFTWTAVAGATGYKFRVSTSPDFVGWMFEFSTKSPEFTPNFDFPANKTFYWKVKPVGISPSIYSDAFTFQSASPLEAPSLDRPTDKDVVNSLTPLLRWKGVINAEKYELQIAQDVDFTEDVRLVESISTLYLFDSSLDYSQTWYWRVRSVDGDGDLSKWSPTRSFHTRMKPVVLLSPSNLSDVDTARPTFSWQPVDGATSYILSISLDETFTEGTLSFSLSGTTFTPSEDLARGYTTYWRVIAIGYGDSSSETYEFESANPPSVPVLIRPQNSTSVQRSALVFNWSSVKRAFTYELQISADKTFADPGFIFKSTSNSYHLDSIQLGTPIWYWRVRAISDEGDTSRWTKTYVFSIKP